MDPKKTTLADDPAAAPCGRKRWTHTNAQDVLPEELLAAVQEHYRGGYLYIPPPATSYFAERRKLVLALHVQGVKAAEIAAMACVSPRRVRQILAQAKGQAKK